MREEQRQSTRAEGPWQDAYRYLAGQGTRSRLRGLLFSPGMLACVAFRLDCLLRPRRPIIASVVRRLAFSLTGAEINPEARAGPGLKLAHTQGIVIGAGSRIGRDVTIYQGVTIGATRVGDGATGDEAYPVIGDRVVLYSGAKVLGGILVGDDAVVGANAVVLQDVPSGSVAVGVPARIVQPGQEAVSK